MAVLVKSPALTRPISLCDSNDRLDHENVNIELQDMDQHSSPDQKMPNNSIELQSGVITD